MKRDSLSSLIIVFLFPCFWYVQYGVATAQTSSPADNADISPQVWSVKIEGNETFSTLVIKNQIATESPNFWKKLAFWNKGGHPLSETEVNRDVIRIRNYYRRRGFSGVNVDYRIEDGNKEWKKHVVFSVDENTPIHIRNVAYQFEGKQRFEEAIREDSDFDRVRTSHPYQRGRRYESIRQPEVIGSFTDMLKNLGFAYAEVDIQTEIDSTNLAADINIVCKLGPRTYFEGLEVEGIETVSENYALKESGLRRGERYSLDKLQDAQQEIFNHHLFRFVTISIPEQAQDSTLDLQIRVRERPLRSLETSIGFGLEEYVRGELGWTHRNAFYKGHQFSARAHASFIEQTVDLDYLFPYIFNTKSSFVISPFGQHLLESSFELLRAGITNSFIYQYDQNLTGSVSYQYTKNQELSRQRDASLPDSTVEYDLSSLQVSGYYRQDQSRDPLGWVVQPYAEVSGFFGTASFGFQKLSVDIRRYNRLTETTKLATRIQSGSLFSANTDSLPNNIRFFLGGTNSVRGWSRQNLGPKQARVETQGEPGNETTEFLEYVPVGGRSMFSFNLEIRQDLNALIRNFGISAFLDGGQVWDEVENMGNRPLQFGLGGGLSYNSPIGPVRVDIGYKLNPTDEDLDIYEGQNFGSAWNRIGIHFSIGQAF